jgi:hypothetical protein
MDGQSLLPYLKNPGSARDRELMIPSNEPGSYAIVNAHWRYIHYRDGGEELYDLKEDPDEWYNLALNQGYRQVMDTLNMAAPEEFHPGATPRNRLKLVIEEEGFHWKAK